MRQDHDGGLPQVDGELAVLRENKVPQETLVGAQGARQELEEKYTGLIRHTETSTTISLPRLWIWVFKVTRDLWLPNERCHQCADTTGHPSPTRSGQCHSPAPRRTTQSPSGGRRASCVGTQHCASICLSKLQKKKKKKCFFYSKSWAAGENQILFVHY